MSFCCQNTSEAAPRGAGCHAQHAPAPGRGSVFAHPSPSPWAGFRRKREKSGNRGIFHLQSELAGDRRDGRADGGLGLEASGRRGAGGGWGAVLGRPRAKCGCFVLTPRPWPRQAGTTCGRGHRRGRSRSRDGRWATPGFSWRADAFWFIPGSCELEKSPFSDEQFQKVTKHARYATTIKII